MNLINQRLVNIGDLKHLMLHKNPETIYKMFIKYLLEGDFVGADMAKKYLHMGFTRSRRSQITNQVLNGQTIW